MPFDSQTVDATSRNKKPIGEKSNPSTKTSSSEKPEAPKKQSAYQACMSREIANGTPKSRATIICSLEEAIDQGKISTDNHANSREESGLGE